MSFCFFKIHYKAKKIVLLISVFALTNFCNDFFQHLYSSIFFLKYYFLSFVFIWDSRSLCLYHNASKHLKWAHKLFLHIQLNYLFCLLHKTNIRFPFVLEMTNSLFFWPFWLKSRIFIYLECKNKTFRYIYIKFILIALIALMRQSEIVLQFIFFLLLRFLHIYLKKLK